MQRRAFLAGAGVACWTAARDLGGSGRCSASAAAQVKVDAGNRLATIPRDFAGLGYEISSVAISGLLSAGNRSYVELVRGLSTRGVIRVGGNTSDDSRFESNQPAVSAPKGTVVNKERLRQLGSFLRATNWKLIWGLNLGSTDEQQAVAEAEAVSAAAQDHLLAFEIGNEPDLFGRGTARRARSYGYEDYLKEFRRYKAAIRARLPGAAFAGPDVASATGWVTRFAQDEGKDLKLLTHHYYRECASATSTLDKLLRTDPKLGPQLAALREAASSSNVPYRICETNSFCGGGKAGVSDSFGAALWVLDFLFRLAYAGCAGVNIETGINQLGFVSSYSPIRRDEHGRYFAAPEYYGMLAFAQSGPGAAVAVDCQADGANLAAYAVAGDNGRFGLTVINKEASVDVDVSANVPAGLGQGRVIRLSGPSLEAKTGVTLGGSIADPKWESPAVETLVSENGRCRLRLPAASAAVLLWGR